MQKPIASEVGPIRPPSESHSLLIRLSRNCPWNRCLFCPVYKESKFSLRTVTDLVEEINHLASIKNKLQELLKDTSFSSLSFNLSNFFEPVAVYDAHRILHWLYHKEYSVFLQDADPLLRKTDDLIKILSCLKSAFPETTRITAYARATTVRRIPTDVLKLLKSYGLTRIHTGLESGSNKVLEYVKKGITKEDIIVAAAKLKEAAIELSLYVMPGLGGKTFEKEHVSETIDAINKAKPEFVRFRTLALNPAIPLYKAFLDGDFLLPSEEDMVKEIRDIITDIAVNLTVFSDHNLNLLMDVNGYLPRDTEIILTKINRFLSLPEDVKLKFIIARRLNYLYELGEFLNSKIDAEVLHLFNKVSSMNEAEREKLFLELRSNSL